MTDDFDLERLGDLWRQQPDPTELEELRRSAEAVRRRAVWGRRLDWIAATVATAVVLILVATSGRPTTMAIGVATILVLLLAQVRQRRLRAEELRLLTGPPEEMLEQSIARLRTSLRHYRFSLLAIGPAILGGYFVASTSALSIRALEGTQPLRLAALGAIAIFCVVSLVFAIRRRSRELERLLAMRQSYRDES